MRVPPWIAGAISLYCEATHNLNANGCWFPWSPEPPRNGRNHNPRSDLKMKTAFLNPCKPLNCLWWYCKGSIGGVSLGTQGSPVQVPATTSWLDSCLLLPSFHLMCTCAHVHILCVIGRSGSKVEDWLYECGKNRRRLVDCNSFQFRLQTLEMQTSHELLLVCLQHAVKS